MKFLTLAAVAALSLGFVSQSFASASIENACQAKAVAQARSMMPAGSIVTDIMQTEKAVLITASSQSLMNVQNPAGSIDITLYTSPSCEITGAQSSIYSN